MAQSTASTVNVQSVDEELDEYTPAKLIKALEVSNLTLSYVSVEMFSCLCMFEHVFIMFVLLFHYLSSRRKMASQPEILRNYRTLVIIPLNR